MDLSTTPLPRGWAIPGLTAIAAPTEWFIEGIILRRGLTVLFGKGGQLKSTLALDMAMSVAAGVEWQGKPTIRSASLYLAAERCALTAERAHVWRHAHSISAPVPCYILSRQPNFRDKKSVERLVTEITRGVQAVGGELPRFVVIDGLSTTWGAGDDKGEMSNPTEVYRYFEGLRTLQDALEATVVVLHHVNKVGGMRDAEAIRDVVDTQIKVAYQQTKKQVTLSCHKQSAAEPFPTLVLPVYAATATAPDGSKLSALIPGTGAIAKPVLNAEHRAFLQVLVDAGGSLSPNQVEKRAGFPRSTRYRRGKQLVAQGLVTQTGSTSDNRYTITKAGRAALAGRAPHSGPESTVPANPREATSTDAGNLAGSMEFPCAEDVARVCEEIQGDVAAQILRDILAQLRQQQEVRYDVPRQSDNLADGLDHLPIDPYEASWGLEELGFDVVRDRRGFTAWWPT